MIYLRIYRGKGGIELNIQLNKSLFILRFINCNENTNKYIFHRLVRTPLVETCQKIKLIAIIII